jgi:hypothetical protein
MIPTPSLIRFTLPVAATTFALLTLAVACSSAEDRPILNLFAGAGPGAGADAGGRAPSEPRFDGFAGAADGSTDAAPCVATDIAERLACIPGLTVREVLSNADAGVVVPAGYRRFALELEQPADHTNPASVTFKQRLSLLHTSTTAPMVLASSGYGLSTGRTELTRTFTSNQIQVEHRFFTPSRPTPTNWKDLNIKQSASDYHRIVTLLKPIYGGNWVNTGASKGGMTSVYHRRFFPNDLNGTVAYVAPQTYGTEDPRFVPFVNEVGGARYADCRAKIAQFQTAVLKRRDEVAGEMNGVYDAMGGKQIAIEHGVLELPFAFWQYIDPVQGCPAVPEVNAPIGPFFAFFEAVAQVGNYEDDSFSYFTPYYYQAATELGGPAVDDSALRGLLQFRSTYTLSHYSPKNVEALYNPAPALDIQAWVKSDGASLMFIYGEFDPWSAGKFELGAAKDSFVFVAPEKNHGARLAQLAGPDKQSALATLTRWMGAPITMPPALQAVAPDFVAGDEEILRRPRL